MAPYIADPQRELAYETAEERQRRERAELLRQAGVRPARNPDVLGRGDRQTVKPYPKWLLRVTRFLP
jgi:hypothetical protein